MLGDKQESARWIRDEWSGYALSLKIEKVLYEGKSEFQNIGVYKSESHGNVLTLDSIIQLTEYDEFAYHEMMAHIPMTTNMSPKKVLVVGGGDGGLVREILKHPIVEHVDLCEIDQTVIDVCRKYFPTVSCGLDDPKVTIFTGDGAEFLRTKHNEYDVIFTDSSDPIGPNDVLYTRPYIEQLFDALNDGGTICKTGLDMWTSLDEIKTGMEYCRAMFNTVEYAWTSVPTYPFGQIGFIVACKNKDINLMEPVRSLPTTEAQQLKYYTPEMHRAAFSLPAFVQKKLSAPK